MSDVPICIMSQSDEMEDTFTKLVCKFVNIFFFKGSCLNIRHLKNSNIKHAQTVVILTSKDPMQPFSDS